MKAQFIKLTRRVDAENLDYPMVSNGQGVIGQIKIPLQKMIDNDEYTSEMLHVNEAYEIATEGRPIIGYPIMAGDMPYGIRTSRIRSYYIHEDKSGADKLVLPSEFDRDKLSLVNFNGLEKGDILYLTMNSLYLARPC